MRKIRCYYTLTLDHNGSEGHVRAIMILDEQSEDDAKVTFADTFGSQYIDAVNATQGIHIPAGFDRLLTEQARKYILKVKTKAEDAPPLMSYQNMIHLNY